jgi:anti-sigma regulatory factor (Ser/Thr protein kinase)/biotin operon repressor
MTTSRAREVLGALSAGPRSAGVLAHEFGISRQAMRLHLNQLRDAGLVVLEGEKRGARWRRVFDVTLTWPLPPADGVAEDAMWDEATRHLAALAPQMSQEAGQVLRHAATEMLNNAIDHSSGTAVTLSLRVDGDIVEVVVADDGVGALQHVRAAFGLASDLDALAHLQKGKQTSDPARHAGEGLFFTSKMVDEFALDSGSHAWLVDNERGDMAVAPGTTSTGTVVRMRHRLTSAKRTVDVFDRFTDELDFTRSRVAVRLTLDNDAFVSRSEAKRLTTGLEEFAEVEVDFANVQAVGQGFVDELFRVWPAQHAGTRLVPINMSEEVAFMVRRGLRPG